MELSQRLAAGEPFAFSELIGRSVREASGRGLGHVFEIRAHWEDDGAIVLDELLVGRGGLLRRLRGPGPTAHGFAWESVVELGDEHIVVRR